VAQSKPFLLTLSQRDELERLLAQPAHFVTPRQRTRLRVILMLSEGLDNDEIKKTVGISRPGIEGIRTAVEQCGVAAVVGTIASSTLEKQNVNNPQRRRRPRGRPGFRTLESFFASLDPDKGVVLELVELVVTRDLQFAVLGIR
jgi:hypothetical protein